MSSDITLAVNVTLTCIECGVGFIFTASDQDYFRAKDYSSPTRCKTCRVIHKNRLAEAEAATVSTDPTGSGPTPVILPTEKQERWPITCSKCKQPDTLPFMPQPGRPAYCRSCYSSKS
jgi:CxxC-x17-CxxC domain-containing protein